MECPLPQLTYWGAMRDHLRFSYRAAFRCDAGLRRADSFALPAASFIFSIADRHAAKFANIDPQPLRRAHDYGSGSHHRVFGMSPSSRQGFLAESHLDFRRDQRTGHVVGGGGPLLIVKRGERLPFVPSPWHQPRFNCFLWTGDRIICLAVAGALIALTGYNGGEAGKRRRNSRSG